jgi:hypothetical protein
MTLTQNNPASYLETLWDALHGFREDCIPEGEPSYDSQWGDITTAMAWLAESLGLEPTADGYVSAGDDCQRNGHRNDGRGCCAECGQFI